MFARELGGERLAAVARVDMADHGVALWRTKRAFHESQHLVVVETAERRRFHGLIVHGCGRGDRMRAADSAALGRA